MAMADECDVDDAVLTTALLLLLKSLFLIDVTLRRHEIALDDIMILTEVRIWQSKSAHPSATDVAQALGLTYYPVFKRVRSLVLKGHLEICVTGRARRRAIRLTSKGEQTLARAADQLIRYLLLNIGFRGAT